MSDFEIIDRPKVAKNGRKVNDETAAVIESATTGKAVRIALNGLPLHSYANRFRFAANKYGLKSHVIKSGEDHLIAWMNKP